MFYTVHEFLLEPGLHLFSKVIVVDLDIPAATNQFYYFFLSTIMSFVVKYKQNADTSSPLSVMAWSSLRLLYCFVHAFHVFELNGPSQDVLACKCVLPCHGPWHDVHQTWPYRWLVRGIDSTLSDPCYLILLHDNQQLVTCWQLILVLWMVTAKVTYRVLDLWSFSLDWISNSCKTHLSDQR